MKSIMTKAIAAMALAFAANVALADADSYLYWMLGDDIKNNLGGDTVDYSYAKVKYGDTYLNLYDGATAEGTEISSAVADTAYYWGKISSTDSTFLFELYNDSDEKVGWLERSYASMLPYISDGTSTYSAFSLASAGVVPEPTSGLLSLFGIALLALRRRKMA